MLAARYTDRTRRASRSREAIAQLATRLSERFGVAFLRDRGPRRLRTRSGARVYISRNDLIVAELSAHGGM